MDPISISAIIISIISGLGALLSRLKFKHCHCGCIDSDCQNNGSTPPPTPRIEIKPKHDEYVSDYL